MSEQPPGPAEQQKVRCWQCGYDLTGVGLGESISTCPECGASFDPDRPSPVMAWPPVWKSGLYLCGGMLLAITLELAALLLGRWGYGEARSMLSVFGAGFKWYFALGVAPLIVSFWLAEKHAHASERWMAGMGLFVAGLAGNVVLLFAWELVRLVLR